MQPQIIGGGCGMLKCTLLLLACFVRRCRQEVAAVLKPSLSPQGRRVDSGLSFFTANNTIVNCEPFFPLQPSSFEVEVFFPLRGT